jgi:hypothetical protein
VKKVMKQFKVHENRSAGVFDTDHGTHIEQMEASITEGIFGLPFA